jgi:glyoxylate reductase
MKQRLRILFGTRLPGSAIDRLREHHDLRVAEAIKDLIADEPEYCKGVDVLSPASSPRVDASLLEAFPHVRLIASYGVGTDHIDLSAVSRHGVTVTNTAGVVEAPTAELTMGLMIGLLRRLREGDAIIRGGGWKQPGVDSMLGQGLAGSRLGIIGLGGIGREVARLAHAFGMNVFYTQRHRLDASVESQLGVGYLEFSELLATADVVSLHCPLTPETHHLIDANALDRMRQGAFLINASRGPVVDEAALAHALKARSIAGAALDVYEREPEVTTDLLTLDNVFLSPHLGTSTRTAREEMSRVLVEQIEAFAEGRPMERLVV